MLTIGAYYMNTLDKINRDERAQQAIVSALEKIQAHEGTEGFRHTYDKAIHIRVALEQAGLKIVRDNKRK